MKVLLVLEATLGGTSRHILDLADGLMDAGLDVHLVYSTLRADRGFATGLADVRARWPTFRCYEIPVTREITFSDIRSYLKLWRYVREHGPFDVIHSHSTKAGFLARLLPKRRRTRVIYSPHGLMTMDPALTGFRRWAVSILESALAYRSDAVVAVSDAELLCAVKTGIARSKLTVIHNGIEQGVDAQPQREAIRDSMGLSPDTVCIGFVGRFCSQKDPGRLIEAFSLLNRQTLANVRLAMVGSGELEATLRQQVSALGLSKHVVFLGPVDGAKYMSAFDVLALTSHCEAFSYVVLEALSIGVPVVTTRVGAADALIADGVTGYICDPWDAQPFANHLQILVEDPRLRVAMSAATRERVAPYTISNMVGSITQLYQSVCARPSVASISSEQCETR